MAKKKIPEIKNHSVYILLDKTDNTFFIGFCGEENVYDAFRKHLALQYWKTIGWIEKQKNQNRKPCIFILETERGNRKTVYSTSLVWTKFFLDHDFKSVETESVLMDARNLNNINLAKYNKIKNMEIDKLVGCKNCMMPTYQNYICTNYIENDIEKIKTPAKEKRRISISLSDEEYDYLKAKAYEKKCTISQYVKQACLNTAIINFDFEFFNTYKETITKITKEIEIYIYTALHTQQVFESELIEVTKLLSEITEEQRKLLTLFNKKITELIKSNRKYKK